MSFDMARSGMVSRGMVWHGSPAWPGSVGMGMVWHGKVLLERSSVVGPGEAGSGAVRQCLVRFGFPNKTLMR